MGSPQHQHWLAAKRVLRYLKGTIEHGLEYHGSNQEPNVLVGFSDSDWGNEVQRRSTTGYIFKMNGAAISWKSQRQETVALSTAEAEYMALCTAAKEAMFLRSILHEIGFDQKNPTMIYEDNQVAYLLQRIQSQIPGRSILTSVIISSVKRLQKASWKSNIVHQRKWLQMRSPNACQLQGMNS